MEIDWEEAAKFMVAILGTGGLTGALTAWLTVWYKNRATARKAKVALGQQVSKWEMDAKMREEDFIVAMRKGLVVEMKARLDEISARLDEREAAERELKSECDRLRREHARCQEENAELKDEIKDLRLKIKVLDRRVRKVENDSDLLEDTPPQGNKPAAKDEGEPKPEDGP